MILLIWFSSKVRKCLRSSTLPLCINLLLKMFPLPVDYTCDKQVLWESAGAFFPRDNSQFTRQIAHFTRSWSSGKMLAFQPRGFVFEPVGMRVFFYKYSEAEGSHFFRLYETFRLCETFFRNFLNVPKESPFLIFCNRTNVKNPKRVPFSNFRHYEVVQNSQS